MGSSQYNWSCKDPCQTGSVLVHHGSHLWRRLHKDGKSANSPPPHIHRPEPLPAPHLHGHTTHRTARPLTPIHSHTSFLPVLSGTAATGPPGDLRFTSPLQATSAPHAANGREWQAWRNTVLHRIPQEDFQCGTPRPHPFSRADDVLDSVPFLWKLRPRRHRRRPSHLP